MQLYHRPIDTHQCMLDTKLRTLREDLAELSQVRARESDLLW